MTGFRLARLELYNWGTFGGDVKILALNGQNTLLTGDIGSGKSTIVDAVTTLLLPAQRISYNKAAGADTRERSLRSYVLGYYKTERNEVTGATRPVLLRSSSDYSVLLGVFTNPGYDATVSLAQVFWLRNGEAGQPDRFYVTADRALSVSRDLAGFGSDVAVLRKRLRATDGVRVHDGFPDYGKDFRRRLGIESEQAMELFHQTVSMKSVGNLTDFVRDHMLEPFEAASAVTDIVAHFEDLTKAHEAVQRAKAQLALLAPLLEDCGKHDKIRDDMATLVAQRAALSYYFADLKAELTTAELDRLCVERDCQQARLTELDAVLSGLREQERALEVQQAGHGGNRLAEIARQIATAQTTVETRQEKAARWSGLLVTAGLDQVETAEQFAVRRREIAAASEAANRDLAEWQNKVTDAAVELQRLTSEANVVNGELVSLRQHKNNIPRRNLDLRKRMCDELGLAGDALPFAGELIAVRDDQLDWEGAAERLLHGFALSILVPDEHYRAVSDWINDHHLDARVVYYRVAIPAGRSALPAWSPNALAAKLDIKDTPFASWLEHELAHRADHECVAAMAEFRRLPKAITKTGQIKEKGGRHEKDDRRRIDDRSTYVLGWSNERKIDALIDDARGITAQLDAVRGAQAEHQKGQAAAQQRRDVLGRLDETRDFSDIDWQSLVNQIEDLKEERDRLKSASAELAKLAAALDSVRQRISVADGERSATQTTLGGVLKQISDGERVLREAGTMLAEGQCAAARVLFDGITELLGQAGHPRPGAASACDKAENAAAATISELTARRNERMNRVATTIVRAMGEFRRQYPVETNELSDSVESADGYRDLHKRLVNDDLPRFTELFKTYLNQNTIRDIAGFQSQLNKQAELIRQRIGTINKSLYDVDYNDGRYIRLEPLPSPHADIRDFRADLRACTDDAVSGQDSDHYSEQKFLQVSRIIERFRGREGLTEADRRWTRFVTDVRNWYTFAASERYREDDKEYEHYADSGGKSGGQKEKLAYTILAASLAYQFKLDWGAAKSRTFRFAVIDEAFGRGSDESTRFALDLFGRLGLQLLIVTPLQKIHVIEPYVSAVGYVDNLDGNHSRLQTMTIEEYQARRTAHQIAQQIEVSDLVPTAGS
jgi:uncharacterized protein YPO0396